MQRRNEPYPTESGTNLSIHLTPAEIATAIVPGLMGLAGVVLIAVLMLV